MIKLLEQPSKMKLNARKTKIQNGYGNAWDLWPAIKHEVPDIGGNQRKRVN